MNILLIKNISIKTFTHILETENSLKRLKVWTIYILGNVLDNKIFVTHL